MKYHLLLIQINVVNVFGDFLMWMVNVTKKMRIVKDLKIRVLCSVKNVMVGIRYYQIMGWSVLLRQK